MQIVYVCVLDITTRPTGWTTSRGTRIHCVPSRITVATASLSWTTTSQHGMVNGVRGHTTPLSVYRSTYSREITDKEQPLLIHRPKRRAGAEVMANSSLTCGGGGGRMSGYADHGIS